MSGQTRRTCRSVLVIAATIMTVLCTATVVMLGRASASGARPGRAPIAASAAVTGTLLRKVVRRLIAAGVPAAIIRVDDGQTVLSAAAGFSDLRTRRLARVTDTFRAGSITKQFVATVVLQLVGEKRLRLSDRVGRWVPGLPVAWRAVTLGELLRQRTGIANYTPAWASRLLTGMRPPSFRYSPRALLSLVAKTALQDAPGTRFSDSNTNYVLLGLAIEHATHKSLGAVLQQRIIRPLGLRHTRYELGTLHGNHLHGYELISTAIGTPGPDGRIDMQPVNGTGYAGSGALTSTVDDLSRYLRALLNGRLLRRAQLRSMQTLMQAPFAPGPDPPPFSPSYWGLGLEGTTAHCGRIYGGTGGVLGYAANMTGTPGGHRIVTVAVNELQSLPGLVAVLQREIPPLICGRVGRS